MMDRIRASILRAGQPELPADPTVPLADVGFDSLMIVLSVSELEKEFKLKIPADRIEDDTFHSLATLEAFLRKLGAK